MFFQLPKAVLKVRNKSAAQTFDTLLVSALSILNIFTSYIYAVRLDSILSKLSKSQN